MINHKEFITWSEFLDYFLKFLPTEARNKRARELHKKMMMIKSSRQEEIEFMEALEREKDRRVSELPRFRQGDEIDIAEREASIIKEVFDAIHFENEEHQTVNSLEFFIGLRKSASVRDISTAIAREPSGESRIPKETFQQVFDRMEQDITQNGSSKKAVIDWPTALEYFTKRGRPLTKHEMAALIEEDTLIKEAEAD